MFYKNSQNSAIESSFEYQIDTWGVNVISHAYDIKHKQYNDAVLCFTA